MCESGDLSVAGKTTRHCSRALVLDLASRPKHQCRKRRRSHLKPSPGLRCPIVQLEKNMSVNLGASGRPTAEMNVTPLIDVLLVLLIIFMIITPMDPHGLFTDV